jgi:hypothetical protein
MVPSYNIPKTVAFFIDLLGFKIWRNDENYKILYKDDVTVHILRAGDIGEMEFYMEVDNVDQAWNNMKDKLKEIKHKAPFDREYGMREVHVIIPESKTLLFIGQRI